jgi:type II secretory pathway pseudopilin PulG
MPASSLPRLGLLPGTGLSGGFAYLWTLMLVAFLGISMVIVGHTYQTSVRRQQERELLFVGHEFRNAIGRFYEVGQTYPQTLEDLLQDPRSPNIKRYLRRIYADPITGKADWELIRIQGKIVGLHSISNKVPIKQANFDSNDNGFLGKQRYADWVFTYPHNLILPKAGEAGRQARVPQQAVSNRSLVGRCRQYSGGTA